MILVLTGTNPYSFERLVKAADDYCGKTACEMFIQLGHTRYIPVNALFERFLSRKELMGKISSAELIISQGGFGSIADCMLAGKKLIAVPRMPELNESPDRQEELVMALEKLDRITALYNIDQLESSIKSAMQEKEKQQTQTIIPGLIEKFLREN